ASTKVREKLRLRSGLGQRPASVAPVGGDGADARGRIGVDARRVTRDEAVELMCHHLTLAVTYYEATPDDDATVLTETERILSDPEATLSYVPVELAAARAFLREMNKYYARLKQEQDEEEQA